MQPSALGILCFHIIHKCMIRLKGTALEHVDNRVMTLAKINFVRAQHSLLSCPVCFLQINCILGSFSDHFRIHFGRSSCNGEAVVGVGRRTQLERAESLIIVVTNHGVACWPPKDIPNLHPRLRITFQTPSLHECPLQTANQEKLVHIMLFISSSQTASLEQFRLKSSTTDSKHNPHRNVHPFTVAY